MIMQSRAIKITLIISSLTLISCATQKKTEQKAAQTTSAPNVNVNVKVDPVSGDMKTATTLG